MQPPMATVSLTGNASIGGGGAGARPVATLAGDAGTGAIDGFAVSEATCCLELGVVPEANRLYPGNINANATTATTIFSLKRSAEGGRCNLCVCTVADW